MILVTLPDKPFMLTAKGTPRRQAILDEYASEIKALYSSVEQSTQSHLPAPRMWNAEETKQFVRAVVTNVIGQSLADTQDLFKHGCDRYVTNLVSMEFCILLLTVYKLHGYGTLFCMLSVLHQRPTSGTYLSISSTTIPPSHAWQLTLLLSHARKRKWLRSAHPPFKLCIKC